MRQPGSIRIKAVPGRALPGHVPSQLSFEDALAERNIFGEMLAVVHALDDLRTIDPDGLPVLIHHDYQGLAAFTTGAWKCRSELSQWYKAAVTIYEKYRAIHFEHVKGHTGDPLNKDAGTLAGYTLGHEILTPTPSSY